MLQGQKGKSGPRGASGTKGPPVSWMQFLPYCIIRHNSQFSYMLLFKTVINIYDVFSKGPEGPPGPQGVVGREGLEGPPGMDGLHGKDGTKGVKVRTCTVVYVSS